MEWSTPLRVAGGKPLSPIPLEIYFEIFECVDSARWTPKQLRRALSNLAFVCRFFHAVTVPKLFRSLYLVGDGSVDEASTPGSGDLFRSILQKKELGRSLACHVEECVFEEWKGSWGLSGFLKMYGRALGQLPNLRSLTLRHVEIHDYLLKSICGLKNLEHLTLDGVVFSFNQASLLKLPSLPLTEFSFIRSGAEVADVVLHIVNPAQLASLTLDRWDVAEGILSMTPSNTLKKLKLEAMQSIPPVLEKSFSLETLEIMTVLSSEQPVFSASTLANLRRLVCRPDMLYLVPGRPISSIELTMPYNISAPALDDMAMKYISLLKQASNTLTDISIPLRLYLSVPFFETFPNVEKLQIDLMKYPFDRITPSDPDFDEVIQQVMCKLPPASARSVVSLRFRHQNSYFHNKLLVNTALQHELLLLLEVAFPNLLDVQFMKHLQWSRATNQESWIGDIPIEDYDSVRWMFHGGDDFLSLRFGGAFQRFCDMGGLE